MHFTPEAWNRAKAYFEPAIARDPSYAEPHAELALGHFIIGMHGMRPMSEVAPVVRREAERAAFEHSHALAPWFAIASGRLAAVLRTLGQQTRADAVIDTMGPNPRPLFGMAVYHLLTSNPDAAAAWHERMIDERDSFALVYARAPVTRPLREHHLWPALAARMKLPALAT